MKVFYDITVRQNAKNYIQSVLKEKENLIVYSPTSIKLLNILLYGEAESISSHYISKKKEIINEVIKNKKFKQVIAIGGGTACDIAKYVSSQKNVKCICIPTMLSTNVYSTNKVAITVNNTKTTINAKLPDKIILDINLLKESMQENLYGFADILSIHTALHDWELSISYNHEKNNNKIFNLAYNLLSEVKYFIINNDLCNIIDNTDRIFYYIGQAGHITNLYGTGKPESGSEHIFAKELESLLNIPHGIAVSIGIILMSLYQKNVNEEILNCIEKLQIFKNINSYNISESMLKDILLKLESRIDRFSIINIFDNNLENINYILTEFKIIVGDNFYVNN